MNSFYTGDPNIDSWIFIGLAVTVAGIIAFLMERSQERSSEAKFEKDKVRFWKEIEEGREPDFTPYKITHDGRRYTDLDCLMHKKAVRKHFKTMDKVVKKDRKARKDA